MRGQCLGLVLCLGAHGVAQEAYLKASNPGSFDEFGQSVAVSGDTLVVGATLEASNATGVNGNQLNDAAAGSGAVYVFARSGGTWSPPTYLDASNPDAIDRFGRAVALSADRVVSAAFGEDSAATGVNGNQADYSLGCAGAAYAFNLDLLPEPWTVVVPGLAGVSGVPQLAGKATLIGGDVVSLALSNAKPGSSAALVMDSRSSARPSRAARSCPRPTSWCPACPLMAAAPC